MHKTRHILAVTLVATALCANRAAMAAVQVPDPTAGIAGAFTSSMARKLASRLTTTLGHAVRGVRLHQARIEGTALVTPAPLLPVAQCPAPALSLNPFQFRLPPPA